MTISTQGRDLRFGEVAHGAVHLNDAGLMVQAVWDELPSFYPGVQTDA